MRLVLDAILFSLLFFAPALACAATEGGVISFPPGGAGESDVTETQLGEVLARVQELEATLYPQAGRQFLAIADWPKPWLAAYAERHDHLDSITIWGGLARAPGMTIGALTFVACHELGHHRGGLPLQTIPYGDWASSEGQADYFAAGCMAAHLAKFGDAGFTAPRGEDLKACAGDARCALITQAAWEFFISMQSAATEQVAISPVTPDTAVVRETLINAYPELQCRLDTVRAAASGQPRPSCWYHASFQLQSNPAKLIF